MSETSRLGAFPNDQLLRLFSSDTGASPAMFWRIHLVKNEISFLSDSSISGLEDSIPRLLQDAVGADSLLAAQDRAAFTRLHERMRQRQPVSEVLRVQGHDGLMRWLLILGAPDPEMSFCFMGLLADCTGLANGILQRGLVANAVPTPLPASPPPSSLQAALARADDLRGLLRVLLDNQPPKRNADAVMLSQIFIAEGRVAVTGVGKPFESVSENDAHPYSGSIAENMVLFDLPYLIVEDTSKSIKPIDWALFIPKGIRSYLALPFFVEGVLREVLIFCSTSPHTFDESELVPYSELAKSLWMELPRLLPTLLNP